MPRNGLGAYTLPAGNPVVTGTTISSTTQNNTLNDIAAALTQSISADGQTPFTGPIQLSAGSTLSASPVAGDNTTKIASTGYTYANFVKQGTGIGQVNTNQVIIGYDGVGKLKATLDATDYGYIGMTGYSSTWTSAQNFSAGATFNGGDTVVNARPGFLAFGIVNNSTGTRYNLFVEDSGTFALYTSSGTKLFSVDGAGNAVFAGNVQCRVLTATG